MTQHELSIIDRHLKGINLRVIWALVLCTAISVSTVLSVYYGFKTELAVQKLEIKLLTKRVERLELIIHN
ncbi:MAG: hypothetical protein H6550_13610 [Chitinophagales bacterium]|nr:hypothetical protein [Chitinophagales bacterium]